MNDTQSIQEWDYTVSSFEHKLVQELISKVPEKFTIDWSDRDCRHNMCSAIKYFPVWVRLYGWWLDPSPVGTLMGIEASPLIRMIIEVDGDFFFYQRIGDNYRVIGILPDFDNVKVDRLVNVCWNGKLSEDRLLQENKNLPSKEEKIGEWEW